MNYFDFKLDVDDINQSKILLETIQKLKIDINKELDEFLRLINIKIQECYKIKDIYNLQDYEYLYHNNNQISFEHQFNNFLKHSQNILNTKQNKLYYINNDHFKILQFKPLINKFKEIQLFIHGNIEIAKRMLKSNKKQNAQELVNNQNQEKIIWKHQTLLKNGQKFKTYTFKKNTGFAETFLCKSGFDLKGIIMAQLFSGIDADGKLLDCQTNKHNLQFSIHEGLDLSTYYHQEEIELDHKKLNKIDQGYEILFNQIIFLKKGMTYTINVQPLTNEGLSTYLYAGKQGENQQYLKFLDKQMDLINQEVVSQQIFTQSPIPGLIIKI
ncbi:unnamed protein product [Paramecium sonneborni]|uniref:Uncharacterized protein n=1 Tax=Paramecium sonneborni TaxID=65129 RepID=A0A8S1PBJ8_9CILI|nr:unnamed protein product [Paramecium sonneborni]